MGVMIKGLEMPNDCMECMFCNHIKSNDYGTYGDCAILGDKERMNLLLHQKHSDCPLVEIGPQCGTSEPMTKTLGIELRHNPSELVELLEEQYKNGEISPIVISESLITLFRMLGEKNRPQS